LSLGFVVGVFFYRGCTKSRFDMSLPPSSRLPIWFFMLLSLPLPKPHCSLCPSNTLVNSLLAWPVVHPPFFPLHANNFMGHPMDPDPARKTVSLSLLPTCQTVPATPTCLVHGGDPLRMDDYRHLNIAFCVISLCVLPFPPKRLFQYNTPLINQISRYRAGFFPPSPPIRVAFPPD